MDFETFITWLYRLIDRSQSDRYPFYCDCCTSKCERNDNQLWIENTDQTNPKLGKKKRFKITIEEVEDW